MHSPPAWCCLVLTGAYPPFSFENLSGNSWLQGKEILTCRFYMLKNLQWWFLGNNVSFMHRRNYSMLTFKAMIHTCCRCVFILQRRSCQSITFRCWKRVMAKPNTDLIRKSSPADKTHNWPSYHNYILSDNQSCSLTSSVSGEVLRVTLRLYVHHQQSENSYIIHRTPT